MLTHDARLLRALSLMHYVIFSRTCQMDVLARNCQAVSTYEATLFLAHDEPLGKKDESIVVRGNRGNESTNLTRLSASALH